MSGLAKTNVCLPMCKFSEMLQNTKKGFECKVLGGSYTSKDTPRI